MHGQQEAEEILIMKLNSGEFINLKSFENKEIAYLYYGLAKNKILKDDYQQLIKENFSKLYESISFFNVSLKKEEIVVTFLQEKALFEFYSIGKHLDDENFIDDLIDNLDFESISKVILVTNNEKLLFPVFLERLYESLLGELDYYLSGIEVDEYIEDINGFEAFYDLMPLEENQEKVGGEIQVLCSDIRNIIMQDIIDKLNKSIDFETIKEQLEKMLESYISEDAMIEALDRKFNLEPDFDFEPDDDMRGYDPGNVDVTDVIFNREVDYDD
jgi:hypothetical protein